MNRRPTLADVAKLAGMSPTSVSLVLNNAPGARIAPASAQRIRDAAQELGYRPNAAARSLRVGKTQTIGFLSDEIIVTRYAIDMIRGVLDGAAANDHQVLIAEFGANRDHRDSTVAAMLDRRPDGLIMGAMRARAVDLPAFEGDVRLVLVNATTTGNLTCVLPAEYQAGRDVAQILLDAGHRRIAVIGDNHSYRTDPRVSATIGDRFRGIEDALAEAGVQPAVTVATDAWEPSDGYRATAGLVEGGYLRGGQRRSPVTPVTGLIALNDRLAFGAYEAAHLHRLRVPEDLSVVSFDDDELASYVHPALTTVRIPYREMGRIAVELLLSGRTHEGVQHLPMPVLKRESVTSPAAG